MLQADVAETQTSRAFNRSDVSQEAQYALPYHYIPSLEGGHFQQHLSWSWGYNYLGGMSLVLELLGDENFESLVDIGCGDGRFLCEAAARFNGKTLLGVDYSQRAIDIARALNPQIDFECRDICDDNNKQTVFDAVTLLEVLEHIPVESVDAFVRSVSKFQNSGGRLILTVPHKNKTVQSKHYQHFDSSALRKIVEPYYEIKRMIFFDKKSRIFSRIINGLLENRFFILNNRLLLDLLWGAYRKHFFICGEKECGRVCVVCRKR